jgi:hypothetical protein
MREKSSLKKFEIDPYGHKELLPRSALKIDAAIFVAEAIVRYSAVGTRESYWLQNGIHDKGVSSLWFDCDEMPGDYFCAAVIRGGRASRVVKSTKMVKALWLSRPPFAVSLQEFSKEGLLKREWLDEFTEFYYKANQPTQVPEGRHVETGELFYKNGTLRYKGEHGNGIPHGKGVGFWENGNVWCDGEFQEHNPHGWCQMYFRDGEIMYEGNFSEGYPKGWCKEYFNNGQLRFEGYFGQQTIYFNYGATVRIWGRLYAKNGDLIHDGEFKTPGRNSIPVTKF